MNLDWSEVWAADESIWQMKQIILCTIKKFSLVAKRVL